MILLRNASPYRASHTLAEAREPFKGKTGNVSRTNSSETLARRGVGRLTSVPKVEDLDWSQWTTKKVIDLKYGDVIFFWGDVYKFQSLFYKEHITNGIPTNILTVLQGNGVEKKLWMDAKLDNELIVMKGNNE